MSTFIHPFLQMKLAQQSGCQQLFSKRKRGFYALISIPSSSYHLSVQFWKEHEWGYYLHVTYNIKINGNKKISDETIKIYGGVKIGQDYIDKDLDR